MRIVERMGISKPVLPIAGSDKGSICVADFKAMVSPPRYYIITLDEAKGGGEVCQENGYKREAERGH